MDLCIECGKRAQHPPYMLCLYCRVRLLRAERVHDEEIRARAASRSGEEIAGAMLARVRRCIDPLCDAPVAEDSAHCADCRDQADWLRGLPQRPRPAGWLTIQADDTDPRANPLRTAFRTVLVAALAYVAVVWVLGR